MGCSRGSPGGGVGFGAVVVQPLPPLPADRLVQRGAGKQALEVRCELLQPYAQPTPGVAAGPRPPVLLVDVPVAVRSGDELSPQVRRLRARRHRNPLDSVL